jgi:pteridine reductase
MMRTALITGGAQRIGKSIANALGQDGYHVCLHYYHSKEEAEETAALIQANGGTCSLIQADLQDSDALTAMMQRIVQDHEALDVLINNASIFIESSLSDTSIDVWDRIMDVNLRAPWLCAKLAQPLLASRGGCIINILDSGIEKVWPNFAAYQISKVGMAQLTKLLAKEFAPDIRVNGIAPGLILPSSSEEPEQWEKLVNRLPLKKQGNPADVVDAVLFFINQAYVTGEILFIDGGYQLV